MCTSETKTGGVASWDLCVASREREKGTDLIRYLLHRHGWPLRSLRACFRDKRQRPVRVRTRTRTTTGKGFVSTTRRVELSLPVSDRERFRGEERSTRGRLFVARSESESERGGCVRLGVPSIAAPCHERTWESSSCYCRSGSGATREGATREGKGARCEGCGHKSKRGSRGRDKLGVAVERASCNRREVQ